MPTDLGQILRDEINRQGLTQYRLAKEPPEGAGIAQTALGKFLRGGDLYVSTASKLFDFLGLEVRPKKKRPR